MTKDIKRLVERATAAFAALALGSGLTIASLLSPAVAHAFPTGGQVQSRALYMSNSTPSATGQSYLVTFKPANTTAIKGIIVDFCSTSPIIGDTCTAPTGFSISASPTVSTAAQTAGTNSPVSTTAIPGGAWTAASINSNRALKLTNATNSTAMVTTNLYGLVISTVTNPSTLGTFYARIITYTSDTGDIAGYATPGDGTAPGSTDALDYGGYALSTALNVSVTAKVQESLSFCTSAVDLSGSSSNTCASATNPALTLGHGTPAPGILDNTAVDGASAYTQASTNASAGLAIRMHATNACANAGLSTDGGTTCNITGKDNTVAASVTAGTTFFGLFVAPSTLTASTPTSTGTITPDGNYNPGGTTAIAAAASNSYGMDNTANSGVTSTYGDLIASSTTPVSQVNNQLMFAATAGLTVPAGIYTGSESLVATGTF